MPSICPACLVSDPVKAAGLAAKICIVGGLYSWPDGKESACRGWRHKSCRFDPWVGKIPWSRKWLPIPVLFLENSMDGETDGLQSMGSPRVGHG